MKNPITVAIVSGLWIFLSCFALITGKYQFFTWINTIIICVVLILFTIFVNTDEDKPL